MVMIPDLPTYLNQEHKARVARSEMLHLIAQVVRQRRARNALQRAMEESVRSGLRFDELKREFVVFFKHATSR